MQARMQAKVAKTTPWKGVESRIDFDGKYGDDVCGI